MRILFILALLAAILGVPFALKPEDEHDPRRAVSPRQVLNIITPHSESIRREFTDAFRRHMRDREGREVFIEWRVPGGTSEIEKILDTEYTFAFQRHWEGTLGNPWSREVAISFTHRRVGLPEDPGEDNPGQAARRAFLKSTVGVGLDVFFGGGAYPFVIHSAKGYLVDSGIAERHPDWFTEDVIPRSVGGEPFYDPEFRWIGTCLTNFGIVLNEDGLERLGLRTHPVEWSLLADPRMFQEVALADPTTSGSVTKAFEMILQQEMRQAVDRHRASPLDPLAVDPLQEALAEGWETGLNLIRRIGANARYFANFSTKIPSDVASGDATAGMCIDYYGRTFHERLLHANGQSRVRFVTPPGGSSLSVDPIALLRGAPNRLLAVKFIEFVLSEESQKLWDYRVGAPGGPQRQALRRLPVRKDLYRSPLLQHFADPEVNPYENAALFHYEAEWTARTFNALRIILKSMCLDSHDELQAAWEALITQDFPPEATALFDDLSPVTYERATGHITDVLKRSKIDQSAFSRQLTGHFRQQYRRVVERVHQSRADRS